MRVLILYRRTCEKFRKTIDDHLFSFKRYVPDVEFYYCDVILHVPYFLRLVKWDAVILHYCIISERFDQEFWKHLSQRLLNVGKLTGYKVAIPQDEYAHTSELWKLFRCIGVETVFTCAQPIDYDKLYPLKETGLKHRISTLTGFVDEDSMTTISRLSKEVKERDIDIGYRARDLPFWLGKHGRIKKELADAALKAPNNQGLNLDISTRNSDVFYGDDWLRFLLRCRTTLGCLGGASLYDPHGQIRKKVDDYLNKHPHASFDEVEKACFPGQDYSLNLFALSPRHFECAMAKSCQILLEGDYQGVLEPNVHYIELKKDFSNYPEVFEKASDKDFCKKIAENAYRDIVESGKYTYRAFATQVIDHIRQHYTPSSEKQVIQGAIVRIFLKIHTRWWVPRMYGFKVRYKWEAVIKPKLFGFLGIK